MTFTPPIKKVLKGMSAAYHIRFAESQLAILERLMSFQGLNEGRRVVSPYHGITVECLSSFGRKEIRIHVDGITAPWVRDVERGEDHGLKKYMQTCQCFPFFSLGMVTMVSPATADAAWLVDGRYRYDVAICNAETYVVFKNVYDTNYGRYSVGQLVLVTIGTAHRRNGRPLGCSRDCLLGGPIVTHLVISPFHMAERMVMHTSHIEVL